MSLRPMYFPPGEDLSDSRPAPLTSSYRQAVAGPLAPPHRRGASVAWGRQEAMRCGAAALQLRPLWFPPENLLGSRPTLLVPPALPPSLRGPPGPTAASRGVCGVGVQSGHALRYDRPAIAATGLPARRRSVRQQARSTGAVLLPSLRRPPAPLPHRGASVAWGCQEALRCRAASGPPSPTRPAGTEFPMLDSF